MRHSPIKLLSNMAALLLSLTLVIAPLLVTQSKAQAQEQEKSIRLQLNKLESTEEGCLVSLVAENLTGAALTAFSVEAVTFDTEGIIAQFVLWDFGGMAANKTRAFPFVSAGARCESISRILVNDVVTCDGGNVAAEECLGLIEPSTLASIGFGL